MSIRSPPEAQCEKNTNRLAVVLRSGMQADANGGGALLSLGGWADKPPDTGALLGGASSRKTEELRSKMEQLESEIASIKKRITRLDITVTSGNYKNVADVANQQAKMSTELEALGFMVKNNRADKRQFLLAVRVIMSHLLFGRLPTDVSFEDESLLRELNIHHEFGLTRGSDGSLKTPIAPYQGYNMTKSGATKAYMKETFYKPWGRKDSTV
jgi:hypothetical protein